MRVKFVPWSGSVSQWANWLSRQYRELEIWVRIPAKAQIFFLSKLYSYTCRQGLDGHVIQMHIMINALCEQRGHPNSIKGRNPDTHCTCCATKDHWELSACNRTQITCAYDQATTYTMTAPSMDALLSSVMRLGSVCMQVMDIHVYGVDMVSIIFQNAFTLDTQAPPEASWCGGHQLQLAVTFDVSAG